MTLRHTAVRVEDIEGSVAFYEDLLGYEVVREFESYGVRNVYVGHPDPDAVDEAAVQLVEADGPVDPGDFVHVALTVEDADAAAEQLDDDRIESGPTTMDEFGSRVVFAEAPEGWGLELIEDL